MLDRLAQLIVDRLRPQLERVIREHFDELRLEFEGDIDRLYAGAVESFHTALRESIPQVKKDLKTEITQQIIRGVKG